MNIFIKILNNFLAWYDRITEEMDVKTMVMIRQSFTLVIIILSIIALYIGISAGRRAADKGGVPLVEGTRDIFEIDISREKEDVTFSGMVDDTEMVEKDRKRQQRTEQKEDRLSFREHEETVVEKDQTRREQTIEPLPQNGLPAPLEPDSAIRPEDDAAPGLHRDRPDAEIVMPEEDRLVTGNEEKDTDDTESRDETTWSPGSNSEDHDSNMVPLDRNGGIVE